MKKNILLLFTILISGIVVQGQAGGYLFSQQSGNYTAVTGTVILSNCTNNNLNTDTSSLVTLPQVFTFSGVAYNQIRVGKNGWITFGSVNPLLANNDFYKAALSNTGGTPGVIQPLYTGHVNWYVDYSHGIRLVYRTIYVNGKPMDYIDVLKDKNLKKLLCDEDECNFYRYHY